MEVGTKQEIRIEETTSEVLVELRPVVVPEEQAALGDTAMIDDITIIVMMMTGEIDVIEKRTERRIREIENGIIELGMTSLLGMIGLQDRALELDLDLGQGDGRRMIGARNEGGENITPYVSVK